MSPPIAICSALILVLAALAVVAPAPQPSPVAIYLSPAAHQSLAARIEGRAGANGQPLTVSGLIEEFAARPR